MEKNKNDDPFADSDNFLKWWKNYFCQIWNVHWINNDKQTKIHTYEPLVHTPNIFDVEIVTEKLNLYKSPGTDKIPDELIQARDEKFCSDNHKLIYII
jgi:hypothetical protein